MKIIGLTGSIGMGKSTAAAMLRRMGVAVYCADEAVHRLMGPGGRAVDVIGALEPDARVRDEKTGILRIDRKVLGKRAFDDAAFIKKLEAVLHPLVHEEERIFLNRARCRRVKQVVLDIPLLFETGRNRLMDEVWVVTAPPFIQRARVMKRPHMNEEKFRAVLARQMKDAAKRKYADIVIPTGLGRAFTYRALKRALNNFL
jgi:dephospho-CoA kinase